MRARSGFTLKSGSATLVKTPTACEVGLIIIDCFLVLIGLTNPFMVMQHSLSDPRQYAVLVLTGFLSALPRFDSQSLKTID
jgi:hypothetical protein